MAIHHNQTQEFSSFKAMWVAEVPLHNSFHKRRVFGMELCNLRGLHGKLAKLLTAHCNVVDAVLSWPVLLLRSDQPGSVKEALLCSFYMQICPPQRSDFSKLATVRAWAWTLSFFALFLSKGAWSQTLAKLESLLSLPLFWDGRVLKGTTWPAKPGQGKTIELCKRVQEVAQQNVQ